MRTYHYCLARIGSWYYHNPSHQLVVVGVTGTKGKSTTSELIFAILSEAGHTTALINTIRFAVGKKSESNLFKMSMRGRFFIPHFLQRAVSEGATHAVLELTSEGAIQHRHRGLELNALVFTNLTPEHIESHGSFEKYAAAKLSLATHLERSPKRPRIVVANVDDPHGENFLKAKVEIRRPFSLRDAEPYRTDERSARFMWRGTLLTTALPGEFNLQNTLAAITVCEALGVSVPVIKKALERVTTVPGRAERVECGQPFMVVVDYAHTVESLRAVYQTYKPKSDEEALVGKLIGVLGSTGGGRDKWKRPLMGAVADEYLNIAILTNEDPYDEEPQKVVDDIKKGFTALGPQIIIDRRLAISAALALAREGDVVLITGKGTDPYIMGPKGSKEAWSDKRVVTEELRKLGYANA